MKKILFFDSWKGGIQFFLQLLPALRERNFEVQLLHLGSWGNEEVTVREEHINGMLVRDISFYKNMRFEHILDVEQPDLVLFLSSHTFAHRAFNRYCISRKIPTINLYHGFVRVQAVDSKEAAYKVNKKAYGMFVLKRLPKMISITLPTYMRSLINTGASGKDWFDFIRNLIQVFTRAGDLRVADDARTTMCLVYADADKQHAMRTYGFGEKEVVSVGNLDLVKFRLQKRQVYYGLTHDITCGSDVMYIDTALMATGNIVENKTAYIAHLLDTNVALKAVGKKLIFKPHPETKRLCNLSPLEHSGVEILENKDFTTRLENCCAVITEPSTLALIPALMALPMFLAQYDRLKELKFGEVLTSYPRCFRLKNLNEFSQALEQLLSIKNEAAIQSWVQQNSGPLPAEDMPKRVVKVIDSLIQKKSLHRF